ncbi:MAG: hypothetical protein JXJ22_11695 [Bacteroidales bacterium]|nr:hypothetical protein [Bacteroidales bacterium]
MKRTIQIAVFVLFTFLFFTSCKKDNNADIIPSGDYVVFAWNDLGMHCLNPTYDELVILPPYNTVWAQVIKRGNPPQIVTNDIVVEYSILNNTSSADKRDYGQFWTSAVQLFGTLFNFSSLPQNEGLTGNTLSGIMIASGDHFIVEGLPVTPVDDDGTWNPYQVAEIIVKDNVGKELITTRATVPTSDEINCAKCHDSDPFPDILEKHDAENGTQLISSQPVLCASCHGSPALVIYGAGSSGKYLSQAIHGSHADRDASCYDCHPGNITKCSRSIAHTSADGNCTTCHGTMANVAQTIEDGRVPWVSEPSCTSCHTNITDAHAGILYRNDKGHGSLYCAVCHGSPHAMIPSTETADNYQAKQYQDFSSKVKSIGSCGVCHSSSRGEEDEISEFTEKHGGSNPEKVTACNVCHTSVPADRSRWPHSYNWTNSN